MLPTALFIACTVMACASSGGARGGWSASERPLSDLSDAEWYRLCRDGITPYIHRIRWNVHQGICADAPTWMGFPPAPTERAACERQLAQCTSTPPRLCSANDEEACRDTKWQRDNARGCSAPARDMVACAAEIDAVAQWSANRTLASTCGRGQSAPQGSPQTTACRALKARCPNLEIVGIDIHIGSKPSPCGR